MVSNQNSEGDKLPNLAVNKQISIKLTTMVLRHNKEAKFTKVGQVMRLVQAHELDSPPCAQGKNMLE